LLPLLSAASSALDAGWRASGGEERVREQRIDSDEVIE